VPSRVRKRQARLVRFADGAVGAQMTDRDTSLRRGRERALVSRGRSGPCLRGRCSSAQAVSGSTTDRRPDPSSPATMFWVTSGRSATAARACQCVTLPKATHLPALNCKPRQGMRSGSAPRGQPLFAEAEKDVRARVRVDDRLKSDSSRAFSSARVGRLAHCPRHRGNFRYADCLD